MPVGVVDRLEAIEVDEQDPDIDAGAWPSTRCRDPVTSSCRLNNSVMESWVASAVDRGRLAPVTSTNWETYPLALPRSSQ